MSNPVLILHREKKNMDIFTRLTPREFVTALENGDVSGEFGTYPDMERINQIKGELYILGEEGSRVILGEKTFYVRFGLSVLIFLGLFYFLTYLVHDPIPLVDETAISLAGAILFSLWYRRKAERGNRMVQMKINVKGSIDRIEFTESRLLKEIEVYLETLEERPLEKILENWDREPLKLSAEDPKGMRTVILKGIESRLGRNNLARFRRYINRTKGSGGKKSTPSLQNLDVPLAVFYHKCRESLGV